MFPPIHLFATLPSRALATHPDGLVTEQVRLEVAIRHHKLPWLPMELLVTAQPELFAQVLHRVLVESVWPLTLRPLVTHA